MALLVVWSSPNAGGITASAKDKIVEGIQAAGKEAEVIHLNQKNIDLCKACGNGWGKCISGGACVQQDDFQELYEAFQRADAIVLVTPVYWHDLSENLKALLDRIRRCDVFTNHHLKDKRCLLVACAGGSGNGAVSCLHNMEYTLNHMGMVTLDRIPITRFNRDYIVPALFDAGKKFAERYTDWK